MEARGRFDELAPPPPPPGCDPVAHGCDPALFDGDPFVGVHLFSEFLVLGDVCCGLIFWHDRICMVFEIEE